MAEAPLRADAARNRIAVLDAAAHVFDEQGVDASTAQIAARAGVGIGTVYRHFPTKADLWTAVLTRYVEDMAVRAERLATADDAGAALLELVELVVNRSGRKNRYLAALQAAGHDDARPGRDAVRRLRTALGALLARAQRSGTVRSDIDVPVLLGIMRAVASAHADQPNAATRRRVVGVVLDALRVPRGS